MNPFQLFYTYFMWQPQINALRFTYNVTNDMGYAIILLAVIFNIPIVYLYFKSFLSMQKQRALSPKMRQIQSKYKEDPLEMRRQLQEFNKKHGINNSATFYLIFFQIVFLTGLYGIIQELGKGQSNYLYSFVWGSDVFTFPKQVFNGPSVTDNVQPYLWITVLTSLNAYFQGLATFKWFPQIKVKAAPDQTDEQKTQVEAMEKSQIFIATYFIPIIYLVVNFNLPLGLGIYNLVSTALTLIRLVFVSFYYRNHTKELIQQMDQTDPDDTDEFYVELPNAQGDSFDNIVEVAAVVQPKKPSKKKTIVKKKKK
jgi:YidC/Oxa1 family membrane protein insertase